MFDLLLPRRCTVCGVTGAGVCRACLATLPAAPDLAAPPGYEACWSLLRYEGPTVELVAALKYRGHRDAVDLLGAAMAELLGDPGALGVELVTWAPTSAHRRRRRGFDQAEQLARGVARHLGRPCRGLLERTSVGAQTGRDRRERLGSPEFLATGRGARARRQGAVGATDAFGGAGAVGAVGAVVVVDDVRTTGATLCGAADALLLAGITRVLGLTLAATI